MKLINRWILQSALLALPAAVMAQAATQGEPGYEPLDDLGMHLSVEERAAIVSAMNSAREISRVAETKNGRPYRRDAHAKATGCVRATFTVNGDIPAQYRHSVFQTPGQEYKAWVRFSNGDMLVQPDSQPDARGMAIKLMGVSGDRIAPELTGAKTQDFVMTNTPAFFNRNVFDYAENATFLAKFERTKWFISLWPPRLHPKQFYRAIQTVSSRIDTPFDAQYYSMLPYQLGATALKFSTRSCPGASYPKAEDKERPDFLTEQMAHTLNNGAACFDFMVQPKVPGANMPMDDATVIWSEKKSPFVPIARVWIPPQTIASEAQQQFCENLSMNPWHGVGQWRPEGSLNRARRVVYNAVSKYRHDKNQAPRVEPDSWCIEGSSEPCTPTQGLHVTKPTWPLPRCFDSLYRPLDGEPVDSVCSTVESTSKEGDDQQLGQRAY